MLEVSNLSRRGGRGRGRGRGRAWAGCKVRAGVRRNGRDKAGRLGEKTSWKDSGRQASTSSGKWSSWCRKETRCMLHNPCRTSLPFPSQVPSPRFQLAGFPASPPALAELGIGLGLRVPKGAGALALSLEAAGKHAAKRRCAAQDGSVETGLAKLIPGRWNGPPRECQAQCGSKTDKRNAAHGVTEGNWGISQSTNPVQLDMAIHAAPPSAALISTDRK